MAYFDQAGQMGQLGQFGYPVVKTGPKHVYLS